MALVKVYITLKPTLLDAQGRVVQNALASMGYDGVKQVRVGKYLEMQLDGEGDTLRKQVAEMCDRLLANPVIENYRFEVGE
jgi:phosphoribosylformylglycinamidine synthase PurS subunit